MAALFNEVMGDIASRVIAFLMDKCSKGTTPATTEGMRLHDLQRLLLRARVIIEEAEGRHITSPLIAYQLNMLRKEMYRGYFKLDSLKSQGQDEMKTKDHDVSNSFTLSKFNSAKRVFLTSGNTNMEKDMEQVLENLNNIMVDVSELVIILNNYPTLYRQPYSMHLYIGKCMFGRQMEMDRVIDFLMQTENPTMRIINVLPIMGPTFVGKSTLVAHVYNDERVRNHFSRIEVMTGDEINYGSLRSLITHEGEALRRNERLLIIIEFSRDADEVQWNSFYSSACAFLGSGSKIIVTSRSNTIIKFGTTTALVLNFLPLEAYWYFFKILTFGSVDSNDHPELEAIALKIARGMNGSFIGANIQSHMLRKKIIHEHWFTVFEIFKDNIQKNISLFGENQYILTLKDKPTFHRIRKSNKYVVYSQYRECLAKHNVPAITPRDIMSGSVEWEGEIEVRLWRSHIPPFKSYVVNACKIEG